jgi:hypothetical protein
MKRAPVHLGSKQRLPAPSGTETDLDALVARYAPVGRRVRRERLVRRSAVAMALPIVAALGFQAWQWGSGLRLAMPSTDTGANSMANDAATRVESALAEFRELKAQVSAETGALSAQRQELDQQRRNFEQRSASLMQQLTALNSQGASLASQLRQFEEQRSRLEATLARVDAERRELETRQARAGQATGPGLEQQLADIGRQRRDLEKQQAQARKQGQLLATEIERINSQRLELEKQREAIEQQRAEVQGLLNQIREVGLNRLREKKRSIDEANAAAEAVARAEKEQQAASPLAKMAAVNDDKLGEMRGGIDMGGDFTVSIGVTRTGSVNGIEQFASALYVDDLTKVNAGSLVQLDSVLIQNGTGNLVTPDTMNNLSQNVATIIQNTLDNQALSAQTIVDVSLQNVGQITQGIAASQAVSDSLSLQR